MSTKRRSPCPYLIVLLVLLPGLDPLLADSHVITALDAFERTKSGELLLIDVRSRAEWRETGVPKGAIPVSIHQSGRAFNDAMVEAVAGDKAQPIGLICARGGRSDKARQFLLGAGFTAVFDVSEGMLGNARGPGWIRGGLPLTSCDDC